MENADKPKIGTANLSELMELGGNREFFPNFPDLPFKPMAEIVDKTVTILDVVPFENDKGPGCAVRIVLDGEMCRIVTHSDAIRKILTGDEFALIMSNHPNGINSKIVKRHSAKSGRDYYALG